MGRLRGVSGGGGGLSLAQQVISNGFVISPVLTFTRAQLADVESTVRRIDGTWATQGADSPRRHFPSTRGGVLIEPARTNFHPNPRFEPIGAGLPTSGTTTAADANVTYTYSAATFFQGVSGKSVRVQTVSAAAALTYPMSFTAAIPSGSQLPSTNYTRSRFMRLEAGSLAGLTAAGRLRSGGGASVILFGTDVPADGSMVRQILTGLSAATPANIVMQTAFTYSAGAAFDATVFSGWDMAEEGAFATTPVLPPFGSPGPATRGADNATMAISTIGTGGAFSLAQGVLIPALPPSGQDFTLLSVNNGTANSQLRVRVTSAGSIIPSHVIGGTATDLPSLGTVTASETVPRRIAMAWEPNAGTFRAVLVDSAGSVVGDQSATGLTVLSSGLSIVRLGAGPSGANAGGMLITDATTVPAFVTGASLPTLAASLPS